MEIIQIAGYSLAGGLLGYALPQLGWDLAQRQNGYGTGDARGRTGPEHPAEGSDTLHLERPAR